MPRIPVRKPYRRLPREDKPRDSLDEPRPASEPSASTSQPSTPQSMEPSPPQMDREDDEAQPKPPIPVEPSTPIESVERLDEEEYEEGTREYAEYEDRGEADEEETHIEGDEPPRDEGDASPQPATEAMETGGDRDLGGVDEKDVDVEEDEEGSGDDEPEDGEEDGDSEDEVDMARELAMGILRLIRGEEEGRDGDGDIAVDEPPLTLEDMYSIGDDDDVDWVPRRTSRYIYNTYEAVELEGDDRETGTRYWQTVLYSFLAKFSEERVAPHTWLDREEWDMERLMLRRYEGRPLNSYKRSVERDKIIIILDTSGSMVRWARAINILGRLASRRGMVEIYTAPNGYVKNRVVDGELVPVENPKKLVDSWRNRRIIYVGDYDGANLVVHLSRRNDVLYICTERRMLSFREHSWVEHDEEEFRGAFIRVWSLDELFQLLRRVYRWRRLWIDPHRHEFGDEEQY